MQYNPQSEREIRDSLLLPPGEYDFEVIKGEDKISKSSGNEMIKLTMQIFPPDDSKPRIINDYLVPGSKMGELKINRFCHCVGLEKTYFDGTLDGMSCEGAAGRLRLTIQSSTDFGDQNSVKDYLVVKGEDETSQLQQPPSRKSMQAANDEFNQAAEEAAQMVEDLPF